MKSFHNRAVLATAALTLTGALIARADLPPWMQFAVSGSAIEAALYRAMDVPGLRALYPRPPAEARTQLNSLVAAKPSDAQLYALRAQVDEQSLDFTAAEQDWKTFVAHSSDKASANFQLAAFYQRRNQGPEEIAALEAAAAVPSPASETFIAADQQQAWQGFPHALAIAHDQGLGDDATLAIDNAWIARYPAEPSVRAKDIATLLNMRRFDQAQRAIDNYKAAFPHDQVVPLKAEALLAFDRGDAASTAHALALFDQAYQPLWDPALVETYFELLNATHTQHAFLAGTRAQLLKNPDDLTAAAKVFDYYQQEGRLDAAANSIAEYESSKESRHATWSADELYTFATLLDRASQYQPAARYYFALASTPGDLTATPQSPEEAGLCGLIHLLLVSPEQPIELGSGNLSMYRDLATTDRGPGYLNGILSLWLNSQDPAAEFHDEEQKATPYFHRAKAVELLAALDQRFPNSSLRPALHAQLIQAYIDYGQDAAVKQAGQQFLTDFPQAPQRLEVALEVADVDARTNDTKSEFALYDSLLTELSSNLQGMPLTAAGASAPPAEPQLPPTNTDDADSDEADQANTPTPQPPASALLQQALALPVAPPASTAIAQDYRRILERYLGRLAATNQLPAALALLRRELDRNPNDPLLYERLADFLQQNKLDAQQEEVYQRAIARFNDPTFYDKLARFYLRRRRQQDFNTLTRKVVDIFQGTELEQYFANVNGAWPQEYLQLNLYAHQRFPHDLVFTRNLLSAYQTRGTADPAAYEHLLREHWQESSDLQGEFFDFLTRTHQISTELTALEALVPTASQQQQDPAATRELAEIRLWQSHFEQSAPLLGQLADQYPADATIGDEASGIFRSLAYFDPAQIARAVAIEEHLSAADPANLDRLATIGDIYADSTATSLNLDTTRQLAQAAPFWLRMPTVHPGITDGYLQSATVFWDYFQFDAALAQITAARRHFNNPALFGYQAGAIYENKRDYPRAIAEYVQAALQDTSAIEPSSTVLEASSDTAAGRLLTLASRPQFAALVDQATAKAAAESPSLPALTLRIDVLNVQHHQAGIAPLVESAIARASSTEALASLASLSQNQQLPRLYEAALQREITLTTDPVQRIQLEYQLANAYTDQSDIPAAQHVIESVYAANPKLIGVVRSTVDFYWNNKQPQRAIATLVEASHAANADLSHDFTLEAIAKSNQSGDFTGARKLLQPLLAADPFNPQYLSLDAQSYSLAHDNAGLRDLYIATIAALKAAPLAPLDRRDRIALARQGLIPALTGLKDYQGAMDQHIALISAFPEDDSILQAAVSYARLHSLEPQLVAFLNKTVAESPRDSRFAIDLARTDVQFEDYAGALAAYSKAIAIRADRPDLFIARADLEEHQQSFDAACADYDRLFLLTYKDPQWMEKAALARARQGKPDLAVKALQAAWLDGRTPSAADNFRVASQLADWNFLPQADLFATQGVKLAGNDLLTNPATSQGAVFYARLLARERKAPEGVALFTRLLSAANASPSSPTVVMQQVETHGLASVTDTEWRKRLVELRRQQAQTTFQNAVQAIAATVADLYTPEEKSSFATFLDTKRANASTPDIVAIWIPAAANSGLKDREASWRRDILLHGGADLASSQLAPYNSLETARMDYEPLAVTLDAYADQLKPRDQPAALSMAATAWHNAGNRKREAADLRTLVVNHRQQQYQQRLFDLYLHGDPAALLQLTAASDDTADAAANFLVANGSQSMAYQAVANRAAKRPPVWNAATSALVGLYFDDLSPATDARFQSALANQPIGQRLLAKPDNNQQFLGDPWFYYGTRYGVFLALASAPAHDPEDYLPAELERSPNNPQSFNALAQTYLGVHKVDAAITEYHHVIELDPTDPTPDVAIAESLWSANRHDEAIAQWNAALTKLRAMVDLRAVPETFWTTFATIAYDARSHQLGSKLQPGMDIVLSAYLRKNGDYRSTELLQSAYNALEKQDLAAAIQWLLSLIADVPADSQFAALADLSAQPWFPDSQRDSIYRREIAVAQSRLPSGTSTSDPSADGQQNFTLSQLTTIRAEYARWLLAHNRAADAQHIFDSIASTERRSEDLQTFAILLAAKQSGLPTLLESYRNDPTAAPSLETLSTTANTLRLQKDLANSRLLLEYVFQQKLQQQSLAASDYLALAEARIGTGDLPGSLDLLSRLTLQGDLYQNLDSAASLLERTGHPGEALPLLSKLSNGTPWNAEYRLRFGRAQLAQQRSTDAANALSAIASSDQALYARRAAAAEALGPLPGSRHFSSAELTQLATTIPAPPQANQPYFVYARISAAANAPLPQRAALLYGAVKVAPDSMLDWLRFRIFQVEIAQSHYEAAKTAIAPVLEADAALRFPAPPENATENNATEDSTSTDDSNSSASATDQRFSIATALATQEDQRTFVLALADMDQHLHNDAEAVEDLEAAKRLSTEAAQKANLAVRIQTIRDRLDLEQDNAPSRPIIQKSVEQTVLVRPRLTTAAAKVQP